MNEPFPGSGTGGTRSGVRTAGRRAGLRGGRRGGPGTPVRLVDTGQESRERGARGTTSEQQQEREAEDA
jgi:hypothetical protein